MTDKRADITPAALAYLGDSVIEVLARERLVSAGIPDSARLNLAAAKYVRATVQSDAVERILPLLDEAEAAVYRRARNVGHTNTPPNTAAPPEWRRCSAGCGLAARRARPAPASCFAQPTETKTEKMVC